MRFPFPAFRFTLTRYDSFHNSRRISRTIDRCDSRRSPFGFAGGRCGGQP